MPYTPKNLIGINDTFSVRNDLENKISRLDTRPLKYPMVNDNSWMYGRDNKSQSKEEKSTSKQQSSSKPNSKFVTNPKTNTWEINGGGSLNNTGVTYTVKAGDTLSKISQAISGDPQKYKELLKYNPEISNPNNIKVGQTIRIPDSFDTMLIDEEQMNLPEITNTPTTSITKQLSPFLTGKFTEPYKGKPDSIKVKI